MTAATSPFRVCLAVLFSALTALSACQTPELILPGKRESLRAGMGEDPAMTAPIENVSRPISLPASRNNAEWPQSFGTESFRTANAALRIAPQRIWSVRIGEGDGRRVRITADPVVGGGLIYTLDSGARVSGVTPAGQIAWSADLTPPADSEGQATGGGLAYADGTLYVSLGFGRLAALDARSGAVRWIQRLEATGSGQPLVVGGIVYLVAGDDTGWAVNASNGRIEWQFDVAPSITNVLGAPAPVLAGDLVVFAFGGGDLVATFRRGGLRRWSATVSGQRLGLAVSRISDITGAPVVAGNRVYVANFSGRMVALDAGSGERIWTARQGAISPVWPAGGSVFAVTDLNQLARLDAADGSVIWAVDMPKFVKDKPKRRAEVYANYGPILAGGRLVTASSDGYLRFFSPQDGSLVATAEIPGGATTGPVVAGSTLYVVSANGELHAFR